MDFSSLKEQQRALRENFPEGLGLRVHRALSWLKRAELCEDDIDGRFIFLWIAFNASYAQDMDDALRYSESAHFSHFIQKLVDLDKNKSLYELLWQEFPSSIRLLLSNHYVFQPFWDFIAGRLSDSEWREKFDRSNRAYRHCAYDD